MNSIVSYLGSLIFNPLFWVFAVVAGALYLMGRGLFGRSPFAALTEEASEEERQLRGLYDGPTYRPQPEPVRQKVGSVMPPFSQISSLTAQLDRLHQPVNPPSSHAVEDMARHYGFDIDVDGDSHTLSLVDTRYPTLANNRCSLPLSMGHATPAEWKQALQRSRMYIERRAVTGGLKSKGVPRQRRVAA